MYDSKKFILVLFFILSFFKTSSIKLDVKPYERKELVKINVIAKYELSELALFIKSHEGLELKPYLCPGGVITIGYGHSILDNEKELLCGITKNQADSILVSDINKCKSWLNTLFKNKLSKNQLTAITHFTYAIGGGNLIKSTLYKKLLSNDSIHTEIVKWCKIGNKENKQLIKQREWELATFYKQ
jgi:lysozyme